MSEWKERKMAQLITRADTFVGACEGLKVAIAHEADPGYRMYLANTVMPFLEAEKSKANSEAEEYRREHFEVA